MPKPAFASDARLHAVASTAKTLWWGAHRAAGRVLVRPSPSSSATPVEAGAPAPSAAESPRPGGAATLRRRYLDAFAKERADVAEGLFPLSEPLPDPARLVRRSLDLFTDARVVEARRRARSGTEAREISDSPAYPAYYRQNFHFQSDGWFTAESAARYETQVEALFGGAAGPMRRRALALLMRHWRGRDHRDRRVVDIACGSGSFLRDLARALPRANVIGLDLSAPYLAEARARSGTPGVQANAERLPFADGSLDAATCVYLFHELPPRVRPGVAAEIARVLKPGGVLAFADALQGREAPELRRALDSFPVWFHEPYFADYQRTDLVALFEGAGLRRVGEDDAFLTKALLFEKPQPNSSS